MKHCVHSIHLCQLAHDLTRTNIESESTSAMRSDGTALLMLADLIRYFSVHSLPGATAGESGFTNQTIFNRLFKEIYGTTPRQARNSSPNALSS